MPEPMRRAAIDNRLKYEEEKQKTRLQTGTRLFVIRQNWRMDEAPCMAETWENPPNLADGLLLVFNGGLSGSEAGDRNAEW